MLIATNILSVFRPSQDNQQNSDSSIVTMSEPIPIKTQPNEPVSISKTNKLSESEIYSYAPTTFFELAHWSKEQNMFQIWERRLTFSIGRYLSNGWLISQKQEKHILRILEEAKRKGFTPTNASIAAKEAIESTMSIAVTSDLDNVKDSGEENGMILEPRLLSHIMPHYLQLHKQENRSECMGELEIDNSNIPYENDDYDKLFHLVRQLTNKFNDRSLSDFIRLPYEGRAKLTSASNEIIETLGDLQRLTLQQKFPTWEELNNINRRYIRNGIKWLECATKFNSIDDEVEVFMSSLDEREQLILTRRFAGSKPHTLEEIGSRLGITRERVRQLEYRGKRKLVISMKQIPCLYSQAAALMLTRLDKNTSIESWKKQLMDNGFLKDESVIGSLITISKACEWPDQLLTQECVRFLNTGVSEQAETKRKPILQKARNICRKSGAVRLKSLTVDQITEADVTKILLSDSFHEIHPGWWTKEMRKYVPQRVARKVIHHCGSVSPMVMKHALGKHLLRAELRPPPSEVLSKLLEERGSISLVNGMLELNQTDSNPPDLTGPEKVFIDLVRKEGPVLSFEKIHNGLLEAGFSLGSVTALLRYSEIANKVQVGLYSALGDKYNASDIDEAKFGITRIPPDYAIRHRTDGIVELEMNVNTWLIYCGSTSAGPASSMKGRWTLRCGDTTGEISVGKGFIYGLGKISQVLDLSLGDRIRIEFNTFTQEAIVTKAVNNEESVCSK